MDQLSLAIPSWLEERPYCPSSLVQALESGWSRHANEGYHLKCIVFCFCVIF